MIPSSPNPGAPMLGEEELVEPASPEGVDLKPDLTSSHKNETQLMRVNGARDSMKSGLVDNHEGGVKVVTHASLEGERVQVADSIPLTVSRV